MRIAILIPNFVESDGGGWVSALQAEELAGEGNYVAIFALAADRKLKNVDMFVIGMPQKLLWQRIYRLIFPLDIFKTIRWLPKLKSFDLVIAYQYPLTWLAYLAKKFYKVKYTFWCQGVTDLQFLPRPEERLYTRLHSFLTRLTVKNVDRAVTVSKYCQKELKRQTGLDSEVIYNRVDLEKFRPGLDGTEIRKKYNLGNDPVILFVGVLRPVKGVHLLIQAFNLVKETIPNAKLVLVGPPDYPYYSKELKRISDDSIIFANFVSHEFLPMHYAICDVYTSGTLWETFNIPIAEAQACGKPVVVFDVGPHPEVVDENGILVEPGNIEKFAQACVKKLKEVRGI